jgi:hypothetical protein
MNTQKAVAAPAHGQVCDFMQHRLERALRERVRYRYVRPRVLHEGESFRIQSPCCSRNVDPSGGMIDIALLIPLAAVAGDTVSDRPPQRWSLCARNHARESWESKYEGEQLDELLDILCIDHERQFWP